MTLEIDTIAMPFVFGASVNCYLVRTSQGFVLIDTGMTNKGGKIEKELGSKGCLPENLQLIILTHGDFDHCGNAGYLRKKFGTQVAIHKDDSGMVERGDMLWNRNKKNILIRIIFRLFFRLGKSDRFEPDLYVDDGYDFSKYGFEAKVLHIPGHSKGSIGILTVEGDLFCGDLLANVDKPEIGGIIDDTVALHASLEKLKRLQVNTVYPGHGKPFPMELFLKNR
jgi:glyoxylase-like metal-dependent hydrolase (beta-lactamase superfamily II)